MYTIAFDTTAAGCSVALTQDERVLGRYVEQMDFGQAEVLIPAIQNLLNEHNLQMTDLGLLTVCVGPGSFYRGTFQYFGGSRFWAGLS